VRGTSAGLSSFEILVALLISIPLIIMAAVAVLRGARNLIEAKRIQDEAQVTLRLEELVARGLEGADAEALLPLPRLHRRGEVTYADGSRNELSTTNSLQPAPGSDALTFVETTPGARMRVRRAESTPDGAMSLFVCPAVPADPAPLRSFLGFGADGMVELVGRGVPHPGNPGCSDLMVVPARSMVAPGTEQDSRFVRLVIPVESIATLYLDRSGRLRYVGHRGGENIENQPLFGGVAGLHLTTHATHLLRVFGYELSVIFAPGRRHRLSFVHRIGRGDFLNALMERP